MARALRIRGDALNREYHLGLYAKRLTVSVPAAPGSGVPIRATTSDDYDSPQVLYDNPAPRCSHQATVKSSSSPVG